MVRNQIKNLSKDEGLKNLFYLFTWDKNSLLSLCPLLKAINKILSQKTKMLQVVTAISFHIFPPLYMVFYVLNFYCLGKRGDIGEFSSFYLISPFFSIKV